MGKKLILIFLFSIFLWLIIKCGVSLNLVYKSYYYQKNKLLEGPIKLDQPNFILSEFDLNKVLKENHLNCTYYSSYYTFTTNPNKIINAPYKKIYSGNNGTAIFMKDKKLFIYIYLSSAKLGYYKLNEIADKGAVGVLYILW